VTFEQMEQDLRQRLEALPPAARAELLHVLQLPDFDPPTGSASSGGNRRRVPSGNLSNLTTLPAVTAQVVGCSPSTFADTMPVL
jgi:hypothetical protein